MSEPDDNNEKRLSRKQPSSAIVDSVRPVGRDSASAKKAKSINFVVSKVTKAITKSVQQSHVQADTVSSIKTLKLCLVKANDIMESMANHQVMSLAPPNI